MSKSYHTPRRKYYSKESPWVRRMLRRRVRQEVKRLIAQGLTCMIERERKTEGWLTW